jgi:tetratricopeptide (TPR) repeat protein
MPKAIKKRVSKKAGIKEEDVKSKALNTLNVLKEKSRILVYALSGLVLLGAITAGVMIYSYSEKRKAYSLETEAYDYYYNINLVPPLSDEQRYEKALELFQESLNTKPSPTALFYKGNSYYNLNDYDNAVETYNNFIAQYADEDVLLPLVFRKLASAHFKKKENTKALNTLDKLARYKNGIFGDIALILQARHYDSAAADNAEEAMKKYRELVRDFPTSPLVSEARAKIEKTEEMIPAEPEMSAPETGTEGDMEEAIKEPEAE